MKRRYELTDSDLMCLSYMDVVGSSSAWSFLPLRGGLSEPLVYRSFHLLESKGFLVRQRVGRRQFYNKGGKATASLWAITALGRQVIADFEAEYNRLEADFKSKLK